MTLELVLAGAVLAFVCALAVLFSHWPRWLKAFLVLGVTVFFFRADALLHQISGLPSADALPERFVLLAAVIEEPAKTTSGALYVWLNPLENGKPTPEPRAYRLPYSKDLHALLDDGMKKVRQGVSQMGSAEPKLGPRGLSWLRPGADEQTVKIRDLPVPQLPEK